LGIFVNFWVKSRSRKTAIKLDTKIDKYYRKNFSQTLAFFEKVALESSIKSNKKLSASLTLA
jgi:hypothetical protein